MGQKVNPNGIRLGIVRDWTSKWYADASYADNLARDMKTREFLKKELKQASVSLIQIERLPGKGRLTIHSARPGVVIGRSGGDIDKLRAKVSRIMGVPVHINIEEIRKPELDAELVAENVATQLENRVMFRRAISRAVQTALKAGAQGVKISVSGRLGGAEIARTEWVREGRVPLHTFRADIHYGTARANTTYGVIGVKVWIYKQENTQKTEREESRAQAV